MATQPVTPVPPEWGGAQHPFLLSASQLQRSLQVAPAPDGTHAALWRRLERGEPLMVGVLGASVAMGAGCLREIQPHVRCSDYDGSYGLKRMTNGRWIHSSSRGFGLQMLDWLNASFPPARSRHLIFNAAADATPVQGLESCLLSAVPATVDLVLLDFASIGTSKPAAAERIMRRLLHFPKRPALVLVNVAAWCSCPGKVHQEMKITHGRCVDPLGCNFTCEFPYRMFKRRSPLEPVYQKLCKHYGQICISAHEALWDDVMAQRPGFRLPEVAGDCLHPTISSRGSRYVSDMLIHALQQSRRLTAAHAAAAVAASAAAASDANSVASDGASSGGASGSLPPTLIKRNLVARDRDSYRCFFLRPGRLTDELTNAFPASALHSSLQRTFARFTDAVYEPISAFSNGSFFVDDKRHKGALLETTEPALGGWGGHCNALRACVIKSDAACVRWLGGSWQHCKMSLQVAARIKEGVVAMAAGATMRVRIDTRPLQPSQRHVAVLLSHLTSYADMGVARVSCEGGCECEAREMDAHAVGDERNVSVVKTERLRVSPSARCVLRLVVLNQTSSGGHKWKLMGVSVHMADLEA